MASTYFLILCFLTFFFFFNSLTAAPSNSSFYFKTFAHNSGYESVLALYGDAGVVNNGSSLRLTAPLPSSVGRVIYKNPIKFYGGSPKKLVSFSTYFTFSISSDSGNGDGLAFVVLSDSYPLDLFDDNGDVFKFKFLSVVFDLNGNHVGIDLPNFVSLKVANLSSVNLGLKSGDILQVWIDYESMSRRLEVRLSKFGENRPVDPMLFERIDLPKIWPESEGFVVGLSSSNKNSSQESNVYSWSFKTWRSPDWMHSEPLDPSLLKQGKENEVKVHKGSDCVMRVLSALILGIGLGALGSFVGMFVWTVFAKRQPVLPEDYAMNMKPVVHERGSGNEKL